MKNILILSLLIFSFAACKSDPNQNGDENNTNIIKHTDVLLLCQEVKQSEEEEALGPAHEVFLQLAESKVKVADILTCETIKPEQYEQYQIPIKAISAVGGWWAGAGDYLYVIEEDGNYVVKKGEMFEESEDGNYNYQVIATYSKKGTLVQSE